MYLPGRVGQRVPARALVAGLDSRQQEPTGPTELSAQLVGEVSAVVGVRPANEAGTGRQLPFGGPVTRVVIEAARQQGRATWCGPAVRADLGRHDGHGSSRCSQRHDHEPGCGLMGRGRGEGVTI